MSDPVIVYKLVSVRDGRLMSWTYETIDGLGFNVEYKVGEPVYPRVGKLFAFKNALFASSWITSDSHLYKAEAVVSSKSIRSVPKIVSRAWGTHNRYSVESQVHRIEKFWKDRSSVNSKYKNPTFSGTVLCDYIKLLERVE